MEATQLRSLQIANLALTSLGDLMRTITSFIVASICCLFLTVTSSNAVPDRASDEWQFSFAPLFLWGVSVDGTSQFGPVSAPLQIDFNDAIEDLSAVFTFHFEAYRNDLALFAEYQFVNLEPSSTVPNGASVDVDFKVQQAEIGAGYRVATWGNTDVEPIIGGRWASQDLEAQLQGGPSLVDSSESWFDFFGGVRLWTHFTDKWSLLSRGDIGAGGSDFVWNLSFILDYQFRHWGSVFVGYRWLDYDYSSGSGNDRYAYDALQQGPLAGIAFHW